MDFLDRHFIERLCRKIAGTPAADMKHREAWGTSLLNLRWSIQFQFYNRIDLILLISRHVQHEAVGVLLYVHLPSRQ